ncbi:hypothetical protein BCR42DRAFT_463573 [Absidia repens]|uniref:IMS import disulfide relay-system CHCH-CHCH-like Cx9C domain-containing protein n=1 Tax=Absidia repens TaxID=90262 RepID=A0A1X2HR70_9FUNG|nr:hypothetical protein BCR42DRAFT_463573 [Absidia repens]
MYQRCVENYPNTWDKSCLQQKRALTKCSEENVGILKFVKQHCTKPIMAYDECLNANPEDPEKCVNALKELYFCTEATSIAYRDQQQAKDEPAKEQQEKKEA